MKKERPPAGSPGPAGPPLLKKGAGFKSGRLNLRFLGRMLWVMLLGNLLLALLLYGWTLHSAETAARALLDRWQDASAPAPFIEEGQREAQGGFSEPGDSGRPGELLAREGQLSLTFRPEAPPGLTLSGVMQNWMPLKSAGTVRRLVFDSGSGSAARLRHRVYVLWLPEHRLEITCDIRPTLEGLRRVLIILACFQLLLLLFSVSKGARAVRRTLSPLYQMIEQARSLTRRTSSSLREVDGMAGELYDIDGRRLHRRISAQDAPEELRPLAAAINAMLDRIEAAYEAQAQFVSDASHELRTPIAVIQGYVNLLDRWGKTDPGTLQESIEALQSEARGMGEMVEQLLFLARGDSDAIPLMLESVDLGALCRDVARDMEVARPDCQITVNCRGGNPPPAGTTSGITPPLQSVYAKADRALCRQALRILLDNAVKYGEGRPVTLAAGAGQPGWAFVAVSDSGPGIAPEDMPRLFDRFYRSDESRARKTGGAGLGLSIARWIAVRHGGQLVALSRQGIGTKMSLMLPEGGVAKR